MCLQGIKKWEKGNASDFMNLTFFLSNLLFCALATNISSKVVCNRFAIIIPKSALNRKSQEGEEMNVVEYFGVHYFFS